jgi:hypothetical protein
MDNKVHSALLITLKGNRVHGQPVSSFTDFINSVIPGPSKNGGNYSDHEGPVEG